MSWKLSKIKGFDKNKFDILIDKIKSYLKRLSYF
jgi:hypothetical protein